jgi:hypothetical protein
MTYKTVRICRVCKNTFTIKSPIQLDCGAVCKAVSKKLNLTKTIDKVRACSRASKTKHKLRTKDKRFQKTYGISLEEYSILKENQGNKCAICKLPETEKYSSGIVKDLVVDHNHSTGKIRELLCSSCNRTLGNVKDSTNLLESMILYIWNHKEQHENTVD